MSRFHQRLRKDLEDPEFAAGYREMDAELSLLQAIEEACRELHITQEELAARMGRHREAITRLLSASGSNPTLETLMELLDALGLRADITLRPALGDEAPIRAMFVPSAATEEQHAAS
jgi:transcriptional regulator with XRE-family HTH domain